MILFVPESHPTITNQSVNILTSSEEQDNLNSNGGGTTENEGATRSNSGSSNQ